jgi:hypothetical protein
MDEEDEDDDTDSNADDEEDKSRLDDALTKDDLSDQLKTLKFVCQQQLKTMMAKSSSSSSSSSSSTSSSSSSSSLTSQLAQQMDSKVPLAIPDYEAHELRLRLGPYGQMIQFVQLSCEGYMVFYSHRKGRKVCSFGFRLSFFVFSDLFCRCLFADDRMWLIPLSGSRILTVVTGIGVVWTNHSCV